MKHNFSKKPKEKVKNYKNLHFLGDFGAYFKGLPRQVERKKNWKNLTFFWKIFENFLSPKIEIF